MTSCTDELTRKTAPVFGVGAGFPVVFSRIYNRPQRSKATPSTVDKPVTMVLICPSDVIFIMTESFIIGNVSRYKEPTHSLRH